MTKNKKLKILFCFILIGFVTANSFVVPSLTAQAEGDVEVLNQKIDDKRREIDVLQREIDGYAENIKIKQMETKSLKNQVAILDNQIAKVNLDIEATEKTIEQTNLEIQTLNLQIQETQRQMDDRKTKIAEYIRLIYRQDQVSYLEIILVNESFSDFFDQMKYSENIHGDLKNALVKLKKNKQDLEIQKSNWEAKAELEEELKNKLREHKSELTEKNSAQEILLIQTRLTEKQYQSYLYQLQLEQQKINSEITGMEKTVREKLEQLEKSERFKNLGPTRLNWPIDPGRGITAYFHDPDYPFRHIFEHPGVDVRAYQGTEMKTAEAGYVGRVKFLGDTSYAYIMIIHNDGLSTVYGHISAPYVKEDEYVTKGQIIGLSGGMPGTKGSGNLSTGPHLHFEVRLDGIPVNPLDYLPY